MSGVFLLGICVVDLLDVSLVCCLFMFVSCFCSFVVVAFVLFVGVVCYCVFLNSVGYLRLCLRFVLCC